MTCEKLSPCKVNLLLNILGKRPDGFHELESLMHPVALHDVLRIETANGDQVSLICNDPGLPTDPRNLVHRAATTFLEAAGLRSGVRLHLEKRIPMAAGLGGGSGNAAITLLGLNELFDKPMGEARLQELAARLGSDVPFFLQSGPALATGRGEHIEPLPPFPALAGKAFLLIHPGFGISTPWAYNELSRFPAALNGTPGRARDLAELLRKGDLKAASGKFYNSLEAPALEKFPILQIYQEFCLENGAIAALMSGSGSTTFALFSGMESAAAVSERFRSKLGNSAWLSCVPI